MKRLIIAGVIILFVIGMNIYESKKKEVVEELKGIGQIQEENQKVDQKQEKKEELEVKVEKLNIINKESNQKSVKKAAEISSNLIDTIEGTNSQKQFIMLVYKYSNQYKDYGILNSVTIAQACLESEYGTSKLATQGKNLFGIKAFGFMPVINFNTGEEEKGKKKIVNANFRKYNSLDESVSNHHYFLIKENTIYRKAGILKELTYQNQIRALCEAGYATDSKYNVKLTKLIERHKLYNLD